MTFPSSLLSSLLKSVDLRQELSLIIVSFFGSLLLLLALLNHGIGLLSDSVIYISTAQNIIEGKGFISFDGEPLVHWAPVYPLGLALIIYLTKLKANEAALALNVVLFSFVIYSSSKLYLIITKSLRLSLLIAIMVIFSLPIFSVSSLALSELTFIFFINLQLISVNYLISTKERKYLFLCALITSLLPITRYVGVTIVLTSIVLIIYIYYKNLGTLRKNISIFIVISLLPFYIWIIRNYRLTRSFLGHRPSSILSASEVVSLFANVILDWFIYQEAINRNKINIFLIIIFILFFIILIYFLLSSLMKKEYIFTYISFFILTYSLFIILSSVNTAYEFISQRILSPIYIPLVILSVNLSSKAFKLISIGYSTYLRSILSLALSFFWMTFPVKNSLKAIKSTYIEGGGYNSLRWQNSEIVSFLRKKQVNFSKELIYTNDTTGLYLMTGIKARGLDDYRFSSDIKQNNIYLICFKGGFILPDYTSAIEKLHNTNKIITLARLSDGEIYLLKSVDSN